MAGVKPSKFINYISEFKKILVTRNNGTITQKFKLDSNITDDYYFSIVNSKNQLVSLTGRNFKIYGSIIDAKEQMHILFYSDNCKIENNGVQMHFNINTFTSQYMAWVKSDRIIDLTIIEVVQPQDNQENNGQPDIETGVTQVILRDQALAYKRPYIEGQTPTQILQKVILTTNVPLTGVFGSGQEISLTDGSNGAAFGTGLDQTGNNQLVIGQYNEVDNTKAFVIGNGDNDSNRKNIFTVDYQGNIEANSIDVASALTVNGSPVATDASIANELSAMSGWATDTFETKTNATNSYNALAEDISAVSDAIPTKVSQLTNDKGYITGVNLDGYATEQWVKNQGYLTAVPNTYALKTDIPTDVATSAYVQSASGNAVSVATAWVDGKNYLTAVPNTYALKTDIPTDYTTSAQVSSIVTSYGYITGYNQGTGIKIENGTISVDGGLGQTYYADDNTLQLNTSTNTFSIKSLSSKLNQGTNIILTPESDGSVTINAIGGGGGGTGGATYLAGLGLGLSTVSAEDSIYKFYVNQTWLDNKIETATSDIQNLSAGTGLQIVDNIISVSAQYLTEVPDTYATKDYVTGAISGKADLSSVYTKEEVYTYIETDVKINEATSGLATKDDLDVVSAAVPTSYVEPSAIENMATTGWVDENYAKIGDTPTDVYTKEEVNAISTALSTAVSDAGYLTEVPNTYALKTDVETASGAAVDVATGWVSSQNYLSEVPSEYITETELSEQGFLKEIPTSYVERDELSAYATNSDLESVSGELVNAIGAKADATALEDYVLTSSMSAYATSAWVDENFLKEHQSLDDYATKELVGEVSGTLTGQINDLTTGQVATNTANITQLSTDFGTATGNITTLSTDLGTVSGKATTNETNISTLSGQVNTASSTLTAQTNYISGVVDTNTTNIGLVDGRVQTIEADYLKAADIAQMATTGYVTGKVNDLATGAVATNTANITQLSTDLGTTSSKLETLSGEVNTTSTTLNNAITGNTQNISTLSTDLGTVSGKANTNETNIGLVSTNLGTLSSELNTTSTFISGKVNTLSGELNTASSTLTAQTNYISGVVDTNTEKITSLSGDVEDLSTTVSTFDSRITQMSGKVDTVSGIVDVLSGDVETIKSDYVTSGVLTAYVNNQFVAVSQLANDVGYITAADIPGGGGGGATYTAGYGISIDANNQISLTASIPTSTSQLTNDSQFATSANVSGIVEGYNYIQGITVDVEDDETREDQTTIMFSNDFVYDSQYIKLSTPIPTTVAELSDASDYALTSQLTAYTTSANVSAIVENMSATIINGLATTDDIADMATTGWVKEQGYLTGVDLTNYVTYTLFKATAITNDFKTAPQISAIITGYGYQTADQVSAIASGYAGGGSSPVEITNKQSNSFITGTVIDYDSSIDVFKSKYTVTSDAISLSAVNVTTTQLSSNEIATFEEWIYTDDSFTTVNVPEGVTLVGEFPSSFISAAYHVFIRRLANIKGTINQFISFAYEFASEEDEQEAPPEPQIDYSSIPLTIAVHDDTTHLNINTNGSPDAVTFYYNKNNQGWNNFNQDIGLDAGSEGLELQEGDVVQISGVSNSPSINTDNYYYLAGYDDESRWDVYGNISSFYNSPNVCYYYLFTNTPITGAYNLYLPSATIGHQYQGLFQASYLVVGPKMINVCNTFDENTYETFPEDCLKNMFEGCYDLHYIGANWDSWADAFDYYGPMTKDWTGVEGQSQTVAESGTFVRTLSVPYEVNDQQNRWFNWIPYGWTVVDLVNGVYYLDDGTGTPTNTVVTINSDGTINQ